jgi:hypothetical protein
MAVISGARSLDTIEAAVLRGMLPMLKVCDLLLIPFHLLYAATDSLGDFAWSHLHRSEVPTNRGARSVSSSGTPSDAPKALGSVLQCRFLIHWSAHFIQCPTRQLTSALDILQRQGQEDADGFSSQS